MKKVLFTFVFTLVCLGVNSQTPLPKVYNENIDPIKQIEQAISKASKSQKNIIVQLGGNWCIWCLRFADFICKDVDIKTIIDKNYEYIHVNIPRRGTPQYEASAPLQKRLNNAGRFGYPVLVVLNHSGEVLHIQDSSFLESGNSYDQKKVIRFLRNWTPDVVNQ